MVKRGGGAFLMAQGQTSVEPAPGASGVGPVMAAAHNWLRSLHAEVGPQGVYAGMLTVSAWINGSASHRAFSEHDPSLGGAPVVDPADLADVYWRMTTERPGPDAVHS